MHDLLLLAYRDGGGSVAPFDAWWTSLVEDEEFDPDLIIIAADADNQPVGMAQCWTGGFVKDLAVAPHWRNQGVGAALLRAAFTALAHRGLPSLDLKVEADNTAAQRFYHRLGMVEVPA